MKRFLTLILISCFCLVLCLPVSASETRPSDGGGTGMEEASSGDPSEEPSLPPEEPQKRVYSGDADGDGEVTAADARAILRAAVGLEDVPAQAFMYADYDNDGDLTAEDARLALRAAVGLEPYVKPGMYTPPEEKPVVTPAALAEAVSRANLADSMKWLVETLGVRSWWDLTQNAAAELLYLKLGEIGYLGKFAQKIEFEKDGVTGYNLLAILPTEARDPDIYLFCAHYDTARGTGGAVDNSSGTAALLELARVLKAADVDYGVEVRFLFTAGEEQGYFGAYDYADSLSKKELPRHRFVFNIDMAGKPVGGGPYYLTVCTQPAYTNAYHSPAAQANAGSLACDAAYAALGAPEAAGYYSPVRAGYHDIIPFCLIGLPSLTLSWRCVDAERSNGSDYDLASPPVIHTPSDNVAHFDMDSLYHTVRLAAWAAGLLLGCGGES